MEETIRRGENRFKEDGRLVPIDYIRSVGLKPKQNYDKIKIKKGLMTMQHGAMMSPEDLNLDYSNLQPEPTPYGGWDEDSTHSSWMEMMDRVIAYRKEHGMIPAK